MKKRDIKEWRHQIEDANPTEKPSIVKAALKTAIGSLTGIKAQVKFHIEQFKLKFAAWTGQAQENVERPVVIGQDHQDARKMRLFAWAGLVLEILLAIWVFIVSLGLSWIFGALTAVLLALFAHILVSTLFRKVERPRESRRKIRKYVMIPSLALFIPSASILLLVRTLGGPIALLFLPVFGFLMWLTTVSLIGLVASLLSTAHLLDWSFRDASEFNALERERIDTETFVEYLRKESGDQNVEQFLMEVSHE